MSCYGTVDKMLQISHTHQTALGSFLKTDVPRT